MCLSKWKLEEQWKWMRILYKKRGGRGGGWVVGCGIVGWSLKAYQWVNLRPKSFSWNRRVWSPKKNKTMNLAQPFRPFSLLTTILCASWKVCATSWYKYAKMGSVLLKSKCVHEKNTTWGGERGKVIEKINRT